MNNDLEKRWIDLAIKYGANIKSAREQFNLIATCYNEPHRRYHTLEHIKALFKHFDQLKGLLSNSDNVAFAIFFHDIIYDPKSSTNEDDSAELAKTYLKSLPDISENMIIKIENMIIATKRHGYNDDMDTAYFLDMDLSILGRPANVYKIYAGNIRQEFKHIKKDLEYALARRDRFLIPFFQKEIYQTDFFKTRFEKQAKINIQKEIEAVNRLSFKYGGQ